jgi:peptide/nickel transport system permease protein
MTLQADIKGGSLPRKPIRKPRSGYIHTVLRRLRYDYLTLFFLALLGLIILSAVFAPLLSPFDPMATSMSGRLKPVGWQGHLLGTDDLGRDMLARILYGGRMSLTMGILPVALAVITGGFLGVVAGFFGGAINMAIMRIMDVFYAFPSVLLAVAISGTMGGGVFSGLLALTLVFIPSVCRIAETATTQTRSLDFVDAARASGASGLSIIFNHIIGNVLPPIMIFASSLVSVSVLLGAGLSFLGLGVQPPTPDWGQMLSGLRQAIYIQPFICALPGLAIFVVSFSFNLVSDGLRHAMDVKA